MKSMASKTVLSERGHERHSNITPLYIFTVIYGEEIGWAGTRGPDSLKWHWYYIWITSAVAWKAPDLSWDTFHQFPLALSGQHCAALPVWRASCGGTRTVQKEVPYLILLDTSKYLGLSILTRPGPPKADGYLDPLALSSPVLTAYQYSFSHVSRCWVGVKLPKTSEGSNSVIKSLLYSSMPSLLPSLNVLGTMWYAVPHKAPMSKASFSPVWHVPFYFCFLSIPRSSLSNSHGIFDNSTTTSRKPILIC